MSSFSTWRCMAALSLAAPAMSAAAPAFAAATRSGYITAVLIGVPDSAHILPTFNKVPGTSTPNLDVALPQALVTHGQPYVVMVMSQLASFSGTCKTSYEITQVVSGVTTVVNKGAIAPYTCSAGNIFGWALGTRPIAGTPGPATLTGLVSFGTQHVRLNVPLLIQ